MPLNSSEFGFSQRCLACWCHCAAFCFCFKARVSIKRLEEFLDLEELDPDNVQRESRKDKEIGHLLVSVD